MSAGWGVFLLAVACASVNVTKAIHVDDTAYLEIARGIRQDPLHPMRHTFLWQENAPAPAFKTNQPHLLFYIQALVMAVFGESELAQHLLMALMVWGALWAFYLLAALLVPEAPLFLTALFALGPSLLPGQNLMTDVPQTGLWALFYWAVLSAGSGREGNRYLLAAVCIAAASLIKYTSLVLLIVLPVALAVRRHWKYRWVLIVPIAAQIAYGAFTYWDFGAVHILARPSSQANMTQALLRCVDWIIGLGAVAPFTLAFLSWKNLKRLSGGILAGGGVAGALTYLVCEGALKHSLAASAFFALFMANGMLCLGLALRALIPSLSLRRRKQDPLRWERNLILGLWLASGFGFIVLLAPFMAIRHVLPVIPAILLLLAYNLGAFIERRWAIAGLAATAALGALLAISDWRLADAYRTQAAAILRSLPPGARVWQAGHYGWQWYAGKEGYSQYCSASSVLAPGAYLVLPTMIDLQAIARDHQAALSVERVVSVASGPATWFRTMLPGNWEGTGSGGYYSFSIRWGDPPWLLSNAPLARFEIARMPPPK